MHVGALIIGAGPVGSTVARLLAEQGHHVLLVEKGAANVVSSPYLSGVAEPWLPLFDQLGLRKAVEQARLSRGRTLQIEHASGGALRLDAAPGLERWLVRREELDRAARRLTEQAGVDVSYSTTVTSLTQAGGRVTGAMLRSKGTTTHVRAGLVIAADGHRSTAATSVDVPTVATGRRVYQGRHYARTRIPPHHYAFLPTATRGVNLLMFADGEGGDAYVELEIDLDRASAPRRSERDQAVAHLIQSTPAAHHLLGAEAEPMSAWTAIALHTGSRDPAPMPGLLLLGDAACSADPLGSSGLLTGLRAASDLTLLSQECALGRLPVGPWRRAHLQRQRALHRFTRLLRGALEGRRRSALVLPWIGRSESRKLAALRGFNGAVDHQELLSPRQQVRLWLAR